MTEKERAEQLTAEIAGILRQVLPPNCGFLFMIANQGLSGWMTYAANIARADAVNMLRDLAHKLEIGTIQ